MRQRAEGAPNRFDVPLSELTAVTRLVAALERKHRVMDEQQRAAATADLSLVLNAVVGDESDTALSFDDLRRAARETDARTVSATPGVALRDKAAYQLLAIGYSAREVADVVSGRISRQALDTARLMIATGRGRDAAANYLDREYARLLPPPPPAPAPVPDDITNRGTLEELIHRHAAQHQVDPALVRAIMAAESAFNPTARSSAGAIGLMQLMPMTARELGVDPFIPEQNVEGGVRYFSQLLRQFGSVELALIAYNAGPGFAQRYLQGHTALYGETREYVARVLRRLAVGPA